MHSPKKNMIKKPKNESTNKNTNQSNISSKKKNESL